jgi:ketosteroid isomerase-like protein
MRSLVALGLLLITAAALANDKAIAREYLKARCRTVAAGATAADVERVLALLADDVVVEHPRANAEVVGKEAVRRGIMSHLADYTGNIDESGVELLESIATDAALALRTRTTFVVGEGTERKVISREGLTIVEVRNGRIARLIEYQKHRLVRDRRLSTA